MKIKNTLIVLFLLIILSSFVFAFDTTDNTIFQKYINASSESVALTDLSPNGFDSTNNGATFQIATGMNFDGVNDYLSLSDWGHSDFDSGYTYNFFVTTPSSITGDMTIIATDYFGMRYRIASDKWELRDYSGSVEPIVLSTNTVNVNTEYMVTAVYDGTNLKLYVDGVYQSQSSLPSIADVSRLHQIGKFWTVGEYFKGIIHSGSVWSRDLSQSEITDLFSQGKSYDIYYTPVNNFDVFELATPFESSDSQEITSTSYQTLFSGSVELLNDSSITLNAVFNLEDGASGDFSCKATVGTTSKEVNIITQSSNEITSNYLKVTTEELTAGFYDVEFECKKNGVDNGTISSIYGILEQSVDEDGLNIELDNEQQNYTLSGASQETIFDYTYTIQGYNQTQNQTTLLLDGSIDIDYNSVERQVNFTYYIDDIEIDSSLRDGSTTGSFAVFTGFNKTVGDSVNLKVKAQITSGSTATDIDFISDVIFKEQVYLDAVNDFNVSNTGVETISTTPNTIYNFNFNGSSDYYYITKLVSNIKGNDGSQEINCSIRYNDDTDNEFSSFRSLPTASKYKVLNNQYALTNATTGSNNVKVICEADTGTIDADSSIVFYKIYAGSLEFNSFDITAENILTSETLNTFSATVDGVEFSTTDGTLTAYYPSGTTTADVVVSANNYISKTFTDYDVSGNLDVDLTYKFFNVTAYDITTSEPLDIFRVTYGGSTAITTNGAVRRFSETELINITVFNTDYRPNNFIANISQVQNISLNSSLVNFTFIDGDTSNPIEDANVSVVYGDQDLDLVTDENGMISFNSGVTQDIYTVDFYDDFEITFEGKEGYISPIVFDKSNLTYPYSENLTINIVTINILIYDREEFSLLDQNATINLFGHLNLEIENGNGSVSGVGISAGEKEILVNSDGYGTEFSKFTYTAQEEINLIFYLQNLSSPSLGTLLVNVVDEDESTIEDATVDLYQYIEDELQYVKVSECFTNSNGECFFDVIVGTEFYYVKGSRITNDVYVEDETQPENFKTDSETRQLLLRETSRFDPAFYDRIYIDVDEYFDEDINRSYINVTYSTIDNLVAEVCVKYYNTTLTSKTFLTEFCTESTDSSTSIQATLDLDGNYNYVAEVTYETDGNELVYRKFTYYGQGSFNFELTEQYFANIFILILWSGLLAFALDAKNISIFCYLGFFLSTLTIALFPNILIATGNVLIIMILAFILNVSRRTQDAG